MRRSAFNQKRPTQVIPKELFRKIRRLEIRTKGLVEDLFGGEYHSAFKGRGIEFSEVRPYQYGDDIRSIDWNVSARTGETYVKVFEEEREQTVMLVVDISASESFGSQVQFKREMAAEICAIIAFSAVKNNDMVGLLLFSDDIELYVPPRKGRRHVLRVIRDLFAHQPRTSGTNIARALQHVARMMRRRSIVMIVSDFLDRDFEKPLRALARRHDTIAIHLHDPRELALPSMGLVDFSDAESGRTVVLDTNSKRVRGTFFQNTRERIRTLDGLFKRLHLDYVHIRTDEGYVDPLDHFFRKRNRRM